MSLLLDLLAFRGRVARAIMRPLATHRTTRRWINDYYNSLDFLGRERFHRRYSRIFYDGGAKLADGQWTVEMGGKPIRLPLRAANSWTDWATAVAMGGHDIEVKQTYLSLLASPQRPEVFLDVGANFGTHSILFAVHGVRAIAFEPNERCRNYCDLACALNGIAVQWEPVAIGDRVGEVELAFPEHETWMGSTAPDIHAALVAFYGKIDTVRVPMRRLEEYAATLGTARLLIKIDVESTEAEVLHGAAGLIAKSRPTVLFESNERDRRPALHGLLAGFDYTVHALPYRPDDPSAPLDVAAFQASAATNFIALPVAALRTSG